MTHEILFLNDSRAYVLVGDVWYDTNKELFPQVGASFLVGRISKVLTYEQYTEQYPESTNELYPIVNEKTISSGYIRKHTNDTGDQLVKYGVNPAHLQTSGKTENERVS
jgi:hypothetical protein